MPVPWRYAKLSETFSLAALSHCDMVSKPRGHLMKITGRSQIRKSVIRGNGTQGGPESYVPLHRTEEGRTSDVDFPWHGRVFKIREKECVRERQEDAGELNSCT
jgi:hypothetical protein